MMPVPRVTVIVDTSGSMDEQDLGLALGIISKVLKSLPNRDGVKVLCGDCVLHTAAKVFDPKMIELRGGGGTDMTLMIEDAVKERPARELILNSTQTRRDWLAGSRLANPRRCLSDAEGEFALSRAQMDQESPSELTDFRHPAVMCGGDSVTVPEL